jgi:ZIP family zinc transporter
MGSICQAGQHGTGLKGMSTSETSTNPPAAPGKLSGAAWPLALIPLLLLGGMLAYLFVTGGGLSELAGPPIEQLNIQRVRLPEQGVIEVEVVNDGPEAVTISQVMVDDAYWHFSAAPEATIPRLGRATITIPYPWVYEEAHHIALVSSLGATFETEIPAAVESPRPSAGLFGRFGLVGVYVGVVPVVLGMLWYPFMRRLSSRAMNFILSLTVGLLVYLAVGTWLDAMEFADGLPAYWQGVPMVVFVALLALGVLLALGAASRGKERSALDVAYLIALGIGLHNLGEGLAIGAAFALGEAALGTFLVLGFTLHNITEGIGIAAPVVKDNPGVRHFALLALLAGAPAILGTWVGGFAYNPTLATLFLAVGVGAILQVIWEVGKLVGRRSEALGEPLINWVTLSGVVTGIAIMFFTAFMVKF